MNYLKIYNQIIQKRQTQTLTYNSCVAVEKHHIKPKSFFNEGEYFDYDDNLVYLTLREHFLAHYLLMKHYSLIEYDHKKYRDMYNAIQLMNVKIKGSKSMSRAYEIARGKYYDSIKYKNIEMYSKYYKIYLEVNNDFDKFREITGYSFLKRSLIRMFRIYVESYIEDEPKQDWHISPSDKIILYSEYYELLIELCRDFEKFKEITGYNKTYTSLCAMFRKYTTQYNIDQKSKENNNNIIQYTDYYKIYKTNNKNFDKFKELTAYDKTKAHLLNMFKKYVIQFNRDNSPTQKYVDTVVLYKKYHKMYLDVDRDFDKFKEVSGYNNKYLSNLLFMFKKYIKEYEYKTQPTKEEWINITTKQYKIYLECGEKFNKFKMCTGYSQSKWNFIKMVKKYASNY